MKSRGGRVLPHIEPQRKYVLWNMLHILSPTDTTCVNPLGSTEEQGCPSVDWEMAHSATIKSRKRDTCQMFNVVTSSAGLRRKLSTERQWMVDVCVT